MIHVCNNEGDATKRSYEFLDGIAARDGLDGKVRFEPGFAMGATVRSIWNGDLPVAFAITQQKKRKFVLSLIDMGKQK